MSVLDDFVRMRLYRERASEFELLAETETRAMCGFVFASSRAIIASWRTARSKPIKLGWLNALSD